MLSREEIERLLREHGARLSALTRLNDLRAAYDDLHLSVANLPETASFASLGVQSFPSYPVVRPLLSAHRWRAVMAQVLEAIAAECTEAALELSK